MNQFLKGSPSWITLYTRCAVILLALLTSCHGQDAPTDPLQNALVGYKQLVEPALLQSEGVANAFVQMVIDDKGNPDAERVAQRVAAEVLPKARDFEQQVQAILPEHPNVLELHQFLVKSATLRVEGYQQIVDGYNQRNLGLFTEGQKKVTESKIQEDTFVARADQIMQNYGMKLVYYSAMAPPPVAQ